VRDKYGIPSALCDQPPLLSTSLTSPRMVNYRDPLLSCRMLVHTLFQFPRELFELTDFFDSCGVDALACCRRTSTVCLPACGQSALIAATNYTNMMFRSSWEFIATLDYEWSALLRPRKSKVGRRLDNTPLVIKVAMNSQLEPQTSY